MMNAEVSRNVIPFEHSYSAAFLSMLSSYYNEDFRFYLNEERITGIFQDLLYDTERSGLRIHLLTEAGIPAGFCILLPYTAKESNEDLSGWFLLRDLFIRPERRRNLLGTFLFHSVAEQYRAEGARGICLTASPSALPFWNRLGFESAPDRFETGSRYLLSYQLTPDTSL